MKLTVVLGTQGNESFDIVLNETPFVTKWVEELKWCLEHCEFQQKEVFAFTISLAQAEQILKNACVTINKYLKNFIDIREPLIDQSQDYFNYLHLKFEQLSGEFGKPTRLFSIANDELKSAIRDLNFYIHRVESKKEPGEGFYISFNKDQYRRKQLSTDDYNEYEFTSPEGTLFLHYVELGKEYVDLFSDNLPLDYKGAKNLHYYSGEAFLSFEPYDTLSVPGYKQWLIDNNIDPYNKTLGHGKIPLGRVENVEQVKSIISNNSQLKKILIK